MIWEEIILVPFFFPANNLATAMKKFVQKILNNPLLAFIFWMILLLTKYIIPNIMWGTLVELGGVLIFIASLINWMRKSKKIGKDIKPQDLKK